MADGKGEAGEQRRRRRSPIGMTKEDAAGQVIHTPEGHTFVADREGKLRNQDPDGPTWEAYQASRRTVPEDWR